MMCAIAPQVDAAAEEQAGVVLAVEDCSAWQRLLLSPLGLRDYVDSFQSPWACISTLRMCTAPALPRTGFAPWARASRPCV